MHSKLPLKSLSEMSNIRRMVLHPNIMRPLGQSFTLFEHKAFEKNAVFRDYILKSKGPNVTGTILNCYFMLQDQSTHTYHSHRYTLGKPKEMNNANDGPYLIFVTDPRVIFFGRCKFLQIEREKLAFSTDLTRKSGVFYRFNAKNWRFSV